jgi:hypothetical protein
MTLFEALSLSKEVINRLQEFGAKPDDCQYIDLYRDYQKMRQGGEKVTYIVTVLSERYHVSERKVYSLVKRFGTDCTVDAV